MKHTCWVQITGMTLVLALAASAASADDPGWPREIVIDAGRIVMFQPQLEEFDGYRTTARVALSVTPDGAAAPVFGVVWIDARVEIDRDTRQVKFYDIRVPRSRFPEAEEARQQQLAAILERELPKWDIELSLDRFTAGLAAVDATREMAARLDMTPPAIVFRSAPSVLVMIDGAAIVEEIPDSGLSRVVNTPFLILRYDGSGAYYLYGGTDAWYTAGAVTGPWSYTAIVPAAVAATATEDGGPQLSYEDAANAGVIPEIVVATEPTELIFTTGVPNYTPLADARLMFVSNTDSTLILEIATQRHFTVLSGRWFASGSLQGPWEYVPSEDLPEAFADIPYDSAIGDIRVHVAGTEEAAEAVLDARVPQTAAVERGIVNLYVMWDGDPIFEDILGTGMRWGVNTDKQVLAAEGRYWACDDAVWYVADSPTGPWEVATARPQEVDRIPPDNPNYNLRYAYIYDATSDVVYVGYTPGYTHTYVHNVTVVFGTGFHSSPWHRHYFWPHPWTWGFHPRFHPWWGWSFGIGVGNGRFTFGVGFHPWSPWRRAWWGPARVHAHWRGFHRGFYRGWQRGFYRGARAGFRAGARAGYARGNIFRAPDRTGAVVRNAAPRPATLDRVAAANFNAPGSVSRTQANNVFADRDGEVFRRDSTGDWAQRAEGGWSSIGGGEGAQAQAAAQGPAGQRAAGGQTPQVANVPQPEGQVAAAVGQGQVSQSLQQAAGARQTGTLLGNRFSGARAGGVLRRRR